MTVLLETAVPAEDAREVSVLADVIRSCAHAERILNGLCNGGWRMQGSRCADVDLGCLCVSFSKEFTGATPLTACENARECGVGDEHSPVFDWVPDVGDDDDGAWDRWEGEL